MESDFSTLPPTKNHDDVYGYAKGGAAKGPASAGFNDSNWQSVELPHDWITRKEFTAQGSPNQGYKERGIGWYRIRFALEDSDRNKQILLEFEGLSADATVYCNGAPLKRSYSGYHGFCVDITDMANFGVVPNTLAVRIDASAWEGWWYEGAGIYRNVWLVKKSPVHIAYQGVYSQPTRKHGTSWGLQVQVDIENSFEQAKEVEVCATLYNAHGGEVGRSVTLLNLAGFGKSQSKHLISVKNPTLWHVDNPYLYTIKTTVHYDGKEQDYQVHTTGFRTIELLADTGFWLNGEPIKLKGFCNHQDHAGIGVAVPYSVREFRLRKLQELGANAFRSAHNPSPDVLDICDKIGLLVMEENRTFSSATDVLEDVRHMVKNARNHPSVVLYSMFNEEPLQGTQKGRRMAGKLQATVEELDMTRPVLGAFNGGYLEDTGAATILHAVGINYNPQRYDDFHAKYPNTPLIGSETASAFMVRGEYETQRDKHLIANYDEECALWGNTVAEAWQYVKNRPFVAGTFVWTGFDYRGEPTPFEWPSVGTFFGTYDSCGFEKDACYLYKSYWSDTPIVHIVSPWKSVGQRDGRGNCGRGDAPQQSSSSVHSSGGSEKIRVLVCSNCHEVELCVNGTSIANKTVNPLGKAEFFIDPAQGTLEARGFSNGKLVATDKQITSGLPKTLELKHISGAVSNNGLDVAVIQVALLDEFGQVMPNADHLVEFSVDQGEILGVGNGDPNSHEPDVAPYRRLFHGLAQLIVKPKDCATSPKPITIHAQIADSNEEIGFTAELAVEIHSCNAIPYIEPTEEQILEGWGMFYTLFATKPELQLNLSKNDMNSFEPVVFSGGPQTEFSGKQGTYGMYCTTHNFESIQSATSGEKESTTYLYCANVLGHLWVYLDNKEVFCRTDAWGGEVSFLLPQVNSGKHQITIIVYNGNLEYPEAGICSPILLQRR